MNINEIQYTIVQAIYCYVNIWLYGWIEKLVTIGIGIGTDQNVCEVPDHRKKKYQRSRNGKWSMQGNDKFDKRHKEVKTENENCLR